MWQSLLSQARAARARNVGGEAEALLQHAMEAVGDDVQGLNQIALFAGLLGRRDWTEPLLRRAVALAPEAVEIRFHLGIALEDLGRQRDAHAVYQEVLERKPHHAAARLKACITHLLPVYDDEEQLEACRRTYADALGQIEDYYAARPDELPQLGQAIGRSQPFLLAYQCQNDRELQARFGRLVQRAVNAAYPTPALSPGRPSDRIRVAIVSAQLHRHSVWKAITRGICAQLNRQRFSLTLFYLGDTPDDQTRWAAERAEKLVSGLLTLETWRDAILAERPDVILYPEIGMDHLTARLAALRLAPVQAALWGHPNTTGYPAIDYFLSGELLEPPNAADHYTEQLVCLPNLGCCYLPLDYGPPAPSPTRAELGLPADAVIYALPHRLFKFLPRFDELWPRIARQVENSVFVFFDHEAGSATTGRFRERLDRAFAAAALDAERSCRILSRLPAAQFFGALGCMDVYLDSPGFSGFNTAMEALRVGLPVVTWEGPLMRGRLASAILRQAGLGDTVAVTLEEYVRIAVDLGRDAARRRQLGQRSRESLARLENDPTVIPALETFLEGAVRERRVEPLPAWRLLDRPDASPYLADYVPRELLQLIHRPVRLALDIGCFTGATGAAIKERFPEARVLGIEPRSKAAAEARQRLDAVFQTTLEDFDLAQAGLSPRSIDTVILADVLEHMVNPWQALLKLRPWLTADAQVLVSLPNVRNLCVLNQLSRGRWEYEPYGLLDVTHLRFFTLTEARAMFRETGYRVRQLGHLLDPRLNKVFAGHREGAGPFDLNWDKLTLKDLSLDDVGELCTRQFLFNLEAVDDSQHAVGLTPNSAESCNALGADLKNRGRLDEAAAALREAIRLKPDFVAAHNNLGSVLLEQNLLQPAVEAYQRALQYGPNIAEVHNNLGTALAALGRLDEASACFEQSLRLQPESIEACNNLGDALKESGKIDQAIACFRRALAVDADFAVGHSNLLLCLNYHPDYDQPKLLAEHRQWGMRHGRVQGPIAPHGNNRDTARRLRIGYVSPDFRKHPVARFLEPLVSHHDPAQIEAIGYAEVPRPDEVTERFRSLLHGWRSTCGLSDQQVADMVRRDAIDILVDLNGHMRNPRLRVFAQKPAPVQATYLGYPNTSGLTTIDYRITDAIADPPGEPIGHTEELIRLPGCFCCYAPPPSPVVAPAHCLTAGHVTFGSMHNLAKLNSRVYALWAEVLRAVPTARLVLIRHTLRGSTADEIRRQFTDRGVNDTRIDFRSSLPPGASYLDGFSGIDILLDALPWNAHTTACESLWMGVPLLTLRGVRHAGRMASSLLTCLNMTDWIAETPAEFVERAVAHSGDFYRLAGLRGELRDHMRNSALCDGPSFARKMETAYRWMWQRWCKGGS